MGHNFTVRRRSFPEKGYITFGQTRAQKHLILLNNKNCRGQDKETLMHEIFHVVSNLTGSNLSEKQVTAMASGLYSVIKDNKKLL